MEDLMEFTIKAMMIIGGVIFGGILLIGIVNGDFSKDNYNDALEYCTQRNSVEYCQAHLNK